MKPTSPTKAPGTEPPEFFGYRQAQVIDQAMQIVAGVTRLLPRLI